MMPIAIKNIALVGVAVKFGATFVARSFSGDKEQLVPLMNAALSHRGSALIDVISPRVSFNRYSGSTKSYENIRVHIQTGSIVDFVPARREISARYEAGDYLLIELQDGSSLSLVKARPDCDSSDKSAAVNALLKKSSK